jgi:glycosyltransferase involved in cell wall biosynthesis
MTQSPMISVVMPVYNAEKYADEAIRSILNQTFTDFEFIIIDDCSTDSSYTILKKYAEIDNRIKLFRNEVNKRLPFTLNFGIKQAKGKYIARMDADDIAHIDRFKHQIEFMENNLDIGVCGTWYQAFKNNINNIVSENCYPQKPENIKVYMHFIYCPIGHPTAIIRRSILNSESYNEDYNICSEDYELWIRLSTKLKVKFANLNKKLLYYRLSDTQITNVHISAINAFQQNVFLNSLRKLFPNKSESKIQCYLKLLYSKKHFPKFLFKVPQYYQLLKKMREANVEMKLFDIKAFNLTIQSFGLLAKLKRIIRGTWINYKKKPLHI